MKKVNNDLIKSRHDKTINDQRQSTTIKQKNRAAKALTDRQSLLLLADVLHDDDGGGGSGGGICD